MPNETETNKNLFDFATKELSQDAFLRWLIESADDSAVSAVSKKFLGWLTGMKGEVRVARTEAQWHRVDIVAELDCSGRKVLLAIEDKVGSGEHNQLQNYNRKLEEWKRQNRNAGLVKVFYKTSFLENSEKTRVEKAGWTIFDLGEIARFFTPFISFSTSEIVRSYAAHVIQRHKDSTEVSSLPMKEWNLLNFQTWFRKRSRDEIERKFSGFSLEELMYQGHYFSMFASRSFESRSDCGVCLEISFKPKDGIVGTLYPRRGKPSTPLLLGDNPWDVDASVRSKMISLVSEQAAVHWSAFKKPNAGATRRIGSIRNAMPFDGESPDSILHQLLGILEEFDALFDDNREQLLPSCSRATEAKPAKGTADSVASATRTGRAGVSLPKSGNDVNQEERKQAFINRVNREQGEMPNGWPQNRDNGDHSILLDRKHTQLLDEKKEIRFEFYTRTNGDIGFLFFSSIKYRPENQQDRFFVIGPFLRERMENLLGGFKHTDDAGMQRLSNAFFILGQPSKSNSESEGVFLKLQLKNRHDGPLSEADLDNLFRAFCVVRDFWQNVGCLEAAAADWNRNPTHQDALRTYWENRCSFPDLQGT